VPLQKTFCYKELRFIVICILCSKLFSFSYKKPLAMARQRFADQVVFVTGGSSGLGAETSQLFIEEGAKVFVTDLEERAILKRLGTNAFFMKCDVSKPEDCEAAINACIEKWGKLDVLFHNAARLAPVSTVVDHDVALFQAVINTNLCSAFYLARVAIPQMRKQGKGAIVNTASTAALYGDYGMLKTCTSSLSTNLCQVSARTAPLKLES
jgi:NAD(P)-dependent dehydrogenase (short-subunit alcohol dehydrogenase family)